jgi:formylglycine-generating enzyme required for sulfatase activity
MKNLVAALLFFIGTAESAVAQKDPLNHEMVFVEGGTFQMGSETGEADEHPVHSVTLNSFNIGKYEVTQAQWKAVMGSNPSYFTDCDQCPVEQVSWNDVQDFIRKLNAQTGKNYRLPTEAEWEYAAKGGKSSKGYTYSGSNDLNSVAWNTENSGSKTHAVGGKQANELGVYDMTGNVWESCSDWYGSYNSYSKTNPTGASSGHTRVLRGGCWTDYADHCRAAIRRWSGPDFRLIFNGFRLVLPAVR